MELFDKLEKKEDGIIKPSAETIINSDPNFVIERGVLKEYRGLENKVIIPDGVRVIGKDCFNRLRKHNISSVIIPNSVVEIEEQAFSCCGLESLELPNALIKIGKGAFLCNSFDTLVIPNSVKVIEEDSFYGNHELERVTFPNGLEVLGKSAFNYCEQLRSIEGIDFKAIDIASTEGVFAMCWGLADENDIISINNVFFESPAMYLEKRVVIPEGVTTISPKALDYNMYNTQSYFKSNTYKELVIPNSVKSLENAISEVTTLKKIHVPRGFIMSENLKGILSKVKIVEYDGLCSEYVKTLGGKECKRSEEIVDEEFTIYNGILREYKGASSEVVIPEGITSIKGGAFVRNSPKLPKVTKVTIPNSVVNIKDSAFVGTKLESIELPKGLTTIGQRAFKGNSIRSITIPESVKKIGDDAFCDCKNLEEVILPKGLKELGMWAFEGCTKLKTIEGKDLKELDLSSGQFDMCEELADENGIIVVADTFFKSPAMYKEKRVVIPEGVKQISHSALDFTEFKSPEYETNAMGGSKKEKKDYKAFQELVIPNSVNTLEYSIHTVINLKTIFVPQGIEISDELLEVLKDVKIVEYSGIWDDNKAKSAIDISKKLEERAKERIKNDEEDILTNDGWTFDIAESEEEEYVSVLTDPEEEYVSVLTDPVEYAPASFDNEWIEQDTSEVGQLFANLFGPGNQIDYSTSYEMVPMSDLTITSAGTVTAYKGNARKLSLPKGIKKIGKSVFSVNDNLIGITLPEGVTEVGDESFATSWGLAEVILPSTLKKIGKYAFQYLHMANIMLPEGLESIGDYAFFHCRKMREITIPKSVKFIGEGAFIDLGVPLLNEYAEGGTVRFHISQKHLADKERLCGSSNVRFEFYGDDYEYEKQYGKADRQKNKENKPYVCIVKYYNEDGRMCTRRKAVENDYEAEDFAEQVLEETGAYDLVYAIVRPGEKFDDAETIIGIGR